VRTEYDEVVETTTSRPGDETMPCTTRKPTLKNLFDALGTSPDGLSLRLRRVRWAGATEAEREAYLALQRYELKINRDPSARLVSVLGFPCVWTDLDTQLTGKTRQDWV
jgi:hypothetical protein